MSNISEIISWEPSVNQIESGEIIKGGSTGVVNLAPSQLANRTQFLNKAVDDLTTTVTNLDNSIDTRFDSFTAIEWLYESGSTTVTGSSIGIFADTSSGSWTVIMKSNPLIGDTLAVNDAAGTWGTNNLIIARNGQRIDSLNEDFVCDVDYSTIRFVYCDSVYGWKLTI